MTNEQKRYDDHSIQMWLSDQMDKRVAPYIQYLTGEHLADAKLTAAENADWSSRYDADKSAEYFLNTYANTLDQYCIDNDLY